MIQTIANSATLDACDLCPFGDYAGLAIPGDEAIASPVASLLSSGGPAYVVWFVIAIIVFAFNGHFGQWHGANVVKESLKRISPTLAHCDATATVIRVYPTLGVEASLLDATPNLVFGSVGFSMRRVYAWAVVEPLQMRGYLYGFFATIQALDNPMPALGFFAVRETDDFAVAEDVASVIDRINHEAFLRNRNALLADA